MWKYGIKCIKPDVYLMKRIVGIATFEGREESLKTTLNSLQNQTDEIFVYDNSKQQDLKDNGKFYGLTQIEEPCYYFTCDDDLIYPEDYIEETIKQIESLGTIVSHHGKIVSRNDFFDSEQYHFSVRNFEHKKLDVGGTGITGFRTDYFNPKHLINSKEIFVSDLLFAIEALKQNKIINLGIHKTNWIKQNMDIDFKKSITYSEINNKERQNKFKNKLLNLKWQI